MDPSSRASTLPDHLKPDAGRSARAATLASVVEALQHGRHLAADELREGLRIAICVLLGGTYADEGLARFLAMGQPTRLSEGWTDAVAFLGALIAEGGGGLAGAMGLPPLAASRDARDVIGDAALYPPQDVAEAMLRGGVAQVEIVGRDGAWAAVYIVGSRVEVDAALAKLDPERKAPPPAGG